MMILRTFSFCKEKFYYFINSHYINKFWSTDEDKLLIDYVNKDKKSNKS